MLRMRERQIVLHCPSLVKLLLCPTVHASCKAIHDSRQNFGMSDPLSGSRLLAGNSEAIQVFAPILPEGRFQQLKGFLW